MQLGRTFDNPVFPKRLLPATKTAVSFLSACLLTVTITE